MIIYLINLFYITGTAQPKMNQAKMNSIVVALPPLAEQERIVKRVEQLLGWCDALEAQLQSAEEERGRLVESVLARVGGQHGE
jgi:type I restriction enzyme, S subunit